MSPAFPRGPLARGPRGSARNPMKSLLLFILTACTAFAQFSRPVLDAHNCYPYEGKYKDRIDRALSTGFPVGIEQDIGFWNGQAVVTHTEKTNGSEPTLKEHFFERVRPIIEKALKENRRDQWPLIILHFDFKDLKPQTLKAVLEVLKEYEPWLATGSHSSMNIDMKPILALTEDADEQEVVFNAPNDEKIRVFGSAHTNTLTTKATPYRRWLNYSWHEIEPEGQPKAGAWTEAKNARLRSVVDNAHRLGFWIRFYTLDGYTPEENQGWFETYNFGSHAAVEARWRAAIEAGVDLIPSDQYEDLAKFMATHQNTLARVKDYARGYIERLQDFTCNQTKTRSVDSSGTGSKYKLQETQEHELSYVDHKEHYTLVKLNGKPVRRGSQVRGGVQTWGEFGSLLAGVFDKGAKAEFTWDRQEGGQCIYRYHVEKKNSSLMMRLGTERYVYAHHGVVYANCEAGTVERVITEMEAPGEPFTFRTEIRYAPAKIGDREFLLPQTVLDISGNGKNLTRAELTFANYRKYDAATSIHFDEDPTPP